MTAPLPPFVEVHLPWLLLGTRVGLDAVGAVFLLLTVLLWTAAGLQARSYLARDPRRGRFFGFFAASLTGNLGLIVSRDVVTFLTCFALMSFAAYGLIVHRGDEPARRAGRVYLVLVVVGEAMLLAGALLAAASAPGLALDQIAAGVAGSPRRALVVGLLFLGFGVKAGILPLHVWLPLAHPVAPTPASAVLSGSMIKAGLLGWIRFLPLGESPMAGWGTAIIVLGLGTALHGVVAGLLQREPKTILAYSSVSQMGGMAVLVGVGLSSPETAPLAIGTTTLYAAHHGLTKGALFLGTGALAARAAPAARRGIVAGMAFAALALAGAPLTSGALAKHYLKEVGHLAPGGWGARLDLLLPLSAVGTALLMARFLVRALQPAGAEDPRLTTGLWAPWAALLAVGAVLLWLLPGRLAGVPPPAIADAGLTLAGLWPLLVGAALAGGAMLLARRAPAAAARLHRPAGALLRPVERAVGRVGAPLARFEERPPAGPVGWLAERWYGIFASRRRGSGLRDAEARLTRWGTAGLLLVTLMLVLYGTLSLAGG